MKYASTFILWLSFGIFAGSLCALLGCVNWNHSIIPHWASIATSFAVSSALAMFTLWPAAKLVKFLEQRRGFGLWHVGMYAGVDAYAAVGLPALVVAFFWWGLYLA